MMSTARATTAPKQLPQFVGYRQVSDAISVSRRTVERMVREGKFPPPVQLAPNRVGWDIEVVRSWLDERGRGLTSVAVSDPDKLAPEDIEPTMRELGARLVAEHIGEAVSPDQIRLVIEQQAPGSDISLRRAELLQQLEALCGHFRYDRAIVIAASLFPAIREQLVRDFGLKWARDPEQLRRFAVGCLDDDAWAEFEDALERTPSAKPGAV